MMDEYCKCRFCTKFDNYDGCQDWFCNCCNNYKPSREKIIEKSQSAGLSVTDVIALISLEG